MSEPQLRLHLNLKRKKNNKFHSNELSVISIHNIQHSLPALLRVWPINGACSRIERRRIQAVIPSCDCGSPHLRIDPRISREQLRTAAVRLINGVSYSTPWKYTKFLNRNVNIHQQALKLRPGSRLNISLENMPTTAYVNKIRRINHQGKPYFIKAELTINTENIPLFLERETKCTCAYCGTNPKSDETACLQCGAPLDLC